MLKENNYYSLVFLDWNNLKKEEEKANELRISQKIPKYLDQTAPKNWSTQKINYDLSIKLSLYKLAKQMTIIFVETMMLLLVGKELSN